MVQEYYFLFHLWYVWNRKTSSSLWLITSGQAQMLLRDMSCHHFFCSLTSSVCDLDVAYFIDFPKVNHPGGPALFLCLRAVWIISAKAAIHRRGRVSVFVRPVTGLPRRSSQGQVYCVEIYFSSLLWRHNGRDGASNHELHHCLLNRLSFKKTSKLRVTGLCGGVHRWPVNSPHKWPVTWKMFPFDYVIMLWQVNMFVTYQELMSWSTT